MLWKNTNARYGAPAMLLHWLMALLFITLYVAMYYRQWFTEYKTPINVSLIKLHFFLGFSILSLAVIRIAYKLSSQSPKPLDPDPFRRVMASSAHLLLYVFMVAMPLTGYMLKGSPSHFLGLDIPSFKDTSMFQVVFQGWIPWKSFKGAMYQTHTFLGAYVVWVLILLHILAGLYHHHVLKDDTLKRMLP